MVAVSHVASINNSPSFNPKQRYTWFVESNVIVGPLLIRLKPKSELAQLELSSNS